MPYDYNQSPIAHQRHPEYNRGEAWIKELLRRAEVAHIATIRDGQPFVTPRNFWYDQAHQRIIIHGSLTGRFAANLEGNPTACIEVSEHGRLLPSNCAMEFGVQYRSVMVFGKIRPLEDADDKRAGLYGLLHKYFPDKQPGREYRPITDQELSATAVYALEIEHWSGKENWKDRAEQIDEWPALDSDKEEA